MDDGGNPVCQWNWGSNPYAYSPRSGVADVFADGMAVFETSLLVPATDRIHFSNPMTLSRQIVVRPPDARISGSLLQPYPIPNFRALN